MRTDKTTMHRTGGRSPDFFTINLREADAKESSLHGDAVVVHLAGCSLGEEAHMKTDDFTVLYISNKR